MDSQPPGLAVMISKLRGGRSDEKGRDQILSVALRPIRGIQTAFNLFVLGTSLTWRHAL